MARVSEKSTVTVTGAMGSLEDSKADWKTFTKRYLKLDSNVLQLSMELPEFCKGKEVAQLEVTVLGSQETNLNSIKI